MQSMDTCKINRTLMRHDFDPGSATLKPYYHALLSQLRRYSAEPVSLIQIKPAVHQKYYSLNKIESQE
jgi:hypothetical protein